MFAHLSHLPSPDRSRLDLPMSANVLENFGREWTRLPCTTADHPEDGLKWKHRLTLATSTDSCQFGRTLQSLLDQMAAVDLCLVFAVGLDCWYPDEE